MLCRRIWQSYNHRVIFPKRFSTAQNVELEVVEKTKPKKPVKPRIVSSEAINHLREHKLEHYLNFIPKKLLRPRRGNISLYLNNRDSAEKFCFMIANDLLKNTSYVIENNPGLGLLTERLLDIGVPIINLYERNSSFLEPSSPLSNLFDKHKNRLVAKKLNFNDIWLMAVRDIYEDENLAGQYLDDAPYFDWKDKTYSQIILFVPSRISLAMIIYNFVQQSSLFTHGRPTFYVALNSMVWNRFLVKNDNPNLKRFYLQQNVILDLFFNHKYLGELPRTSFWPWPQKKANAKIDEFNIPMSIVKLEPKKNAFELLDRENLKPFYFFLKCCLRKVKTNVIAQVETFSSGCGASLIEKNIDITTRFKELSPQMLLEVFKTFRASPKYDESSFMPIKDVKDVIALHQNEEEKNKNQETKSDSREEKEEGKVEEKENEKPTSEPPTSL